MGKYTRKGYELDQTGQEAQDLLNAINNKVDKEDGKSLISDEDKAKLDNIEERAQRNTIETIKRNGVALPINDKGVNISVPTKVADLEQDYTHRTVTDAEKDKWNDKQEKPAPVRYAVLKSMRDTGGLTVGKTYRITDYVATVRRSAQYSEAMSANHPFDIIVTAIDERHLSEECLAAMHEGDIYFANSDLSAWKIWYTIDNDTATYDWADPANGKGVIYRMIDEYANDLGYDFKGILIARHPVAPAEGYENVLSDISGMWLGTNSSALPAGITVDTTQTKWFYTFSHLTDGWDNPTDASLRKGINAVYNVTITSIMRSNTRFLSGNVFMGGPFVVSTLVAMGASVEKVGDSHAMHFRAMGDCSGNSFFGYVGSSDCMSQLRHNIFVGEFRHNRFATDVEGNTIVAPEDISFNDMWCGNMVVRARAFSYNSGGGYTPGTVLKTSEYVSYNKFPNSFADNRITAAGNISANDFGTSFYQNTFTLTGQFTGNKFTGYCYENNFGCSNFTNNEAAYFHANTLSTTEGVNACVFGPYFESNTLGGRLTNVRFSSGQTRFCNFSGIVGCTFDGIMEYVTVPTVSGKRFTHCDVRGGVRGTSSVPVVLDYDAFFLASAAGVSRRVTIEGSADGKIVAMWADGGALKGVMKAPNGNWADMGFVTKAVNDLLNYYLKSETYTKTEVNQLVAGINNWEIVSVAQLPEASADTMHKIYFVPSSSPEARNVKDEYITIENSGIYSWEQIGSTTIDLTNYVTKQEFNIALADYVTSSAFTQALATKQDTLVSGQNIKTLNGFSILGGGNLQLPGPVQSDWNEDDDGDYAYIKNKPNLSDYNPRIYVGTCSTAAATAAKVVTVEEFPLDSNDMPLVGTTIAVKFASTNSAANPTLDVNGIGNEQIWYGSAAYTSASNIAGNAGRYTFYMWDGTYWVWLSHSMDNDTNTLAYQVRYNNGTRNMTDYLGRYRLLFSSADGSKFVPSTTSTATDATTKRDVCQTPIDPFGLIVYYSSTSAVNAGSAPGATVLYTQQNVPLGYAFNRTGAALTLTNKLPVYVKCRPLGDGSAVIDPDEPYVQALPNTEDGKIYIYLGNAHSATNIELSITHPVYHYSDGAIRQWTNQSGATQLEPDVEYTKRAVIPFAKRARIEAIKGRSLAWNQLDNYNYYSDLVNSLNTYFDTVTVKSDGTYHVSGTLTAAKSWNLLTPINFIAGHKYAVIAKPVNGVNYKIENNSAGATSGKKWIGTQNTSGSYRVGIYILAGTYDTDFDRPLIFDLTIMFGSGHEPETVAEFEALYPHSYYGYDSGSLISNAATGIKVGGKNLLKMTGRTEYGGTGSPTAKFELDDTMVIKGFAGNGYIGAVTIASYTISEGKISVTTSSSSNSASYGIGIPFKVNPGWTYRIGFDRDSASATGVGLTWIDQAGYIISSETWYAINSKTAPSNAALAILDFKPGAISTTAVWENIMLTVNTPSTYEPYVSPHTVSLPITTMTGKLNGEGESVTIFPEGMRSAMDAYDRLVVDNDGWCRRAIRTVFSLDLGDLNWTYNKNGQGAFSNSSSASLFSSGRNLCSGYISANNARPANMPDKSIAINSAPLITSGNFNNKEIVIKDSSYTDADAFKTAVTGIKLNYEGYPAEYVLDTPLDITYATGYTEERLPEDTASSVLAPLRVDVRYGTSTGEILGMIGDVETLLAAL